MWQVSTDCGSNVITKYFSNLFSFVSHLEVGGFWWVFCSVPPRTSLTWLVVLFLFCRLCATWITRKHSLYENDMREICPTFNILLKALMHGCQESKCGHRWMWFTGVTKGTLACSLSPFLSLSFASWNSAFSLVWFWDSDLFVFYLLGYLFIELDCK